MPPAGPSPSLVPRHPTAERILLAAIRMMDAEGEAGLRVDAVVAEAGVTIPVLYHHFGNREGLVRAAHVRRLGSAMDALLTRFGDAVLAAGSRSEFVAIFDAAMATVAANVHDRAIRVNVLGATYGRPEMRAEVAEIQLAVYRRLADLLTVPQERGWIRSDLELTTFGGWLFGVMLGRHVLDIQDGALDGDAWTAMTRRAIDAAMYDEPPER